MGRTIILVVMVVSKSWSGLWRSGRERLKLSSTYFPGLKEWT